MSVIGPSERTGPIVSIGADVDLEALNAAIREGVRGKIEAGVYPTDLLAPEREGADALNSSLQALRGTLLLPLDLELRSPRPLLGPAVTLAKTAAWRSLHWYWRALRHQLALFSSHVAATLYLMAERLDVVEERAAMRATELEWRIARLEAAAGPRALGEPDWTALLEGAEPPFAAVPPAADTLEAAGVELQRVSLKDGVPLPGVQPASLGALVLDQGSLASFNDPAELIREAARILRPNGVLVLETVDELQGLVRSEGFEIRKAHRLTEPLGEPGPQGAGWEAAVSRLERALPGANRVALVARR